MNELARIEQPTVDNLIPKNMDEAMRLANFMATAKLVPVALQKSPADCLMVVLQAVRWQMDPFAGSAGMQRHPEQAHAFRQARRRCRQHPWRPHANLRLSFEYDGEGDKRYIIVSGHLKDEAEPRTVTVTLKEARTQNSMWTKQPDQQLAYHGSRVWARRHAPELMLGVPTRRKSLMTARQKERRAPTPAPLKLAIPRDVHKPLADAQLQHDPETGEIVDDDTDPVQEHGTNPSVAPDASAAPEGFDFGAAGETTTDRIKRIDDALAIAASKGKAALKEAWGEVTVDDQRLMKAALDRRHKPAAVAADKAAATA